MLDSTAKLTRRASYLIRSGTTEDPREAVLQALQENGIDPYSNSTLVSKMLTDLKRRARVSVRLSKKRGSTPSKLANLADQNVTKA